MKIRFENGLFSNVSMLFGFAKEEGLSIFKNIIIKLKTETEFSKRQINVSLTFEPFVKNIKAQDLAISFP